MKLGPQYSTINMNTMPGEMKLKGKTLMQQALNVNYQDIPRDIQLMRQEEYKKEVKEGEFVPEFSAWTKEFDGWGKGLGAWTKEFDGWSKKNLGGFDVFALGLIGMIIHLGVLGLAIYGGYCLYQNRHSFGRNRKKK